MDADATRKQLAAALARVAAGGVTELRLTSRPMFVSRLGAADDVQVAAER